MLYVVEVGGSSSEECVVAPGAGHVDNDEGDHSWGHEHLAEWGEGQGLRVS